MIRWLIAIALVPCAALAQTPYLGDYAEDQTVRFLYTTVDSAGEPITKATDGTIYVYKDGASGTEVTTGVVETEDFDSLTGIHLVTITTTDTFYSAGSDYEAVLKGAVIDGVTVDSPLRTWSIEHRNEDANLTAINGTAQDATDLADFASDGYDPTANKVQGVVLADTATGVTNAVTTDSASRTASQADVSDIPTNAEFEARTLLAAGYFDPDADTVANVTTTGTVTNPVTAGTVSDKTGYSLVADQSSVTIGTVNTLTGHTAQTGDSYARLGAPAGASVSADIAAVPTAAENAVANWDEVITPAAHGVKNSAARALWSAAKEMDNGTAQAGTTNTITLAATASTVDGAYDPSFIWITDGTGEGQSNLILEYNGVTKVAVVHRDWRTTPASDSDYVITAFPGWENVNEGLAQGGASNTITLNTYASAVDDTYNGQVVKLVSGTGADQNALVIDYVGATKVATIYGTWATTPDATTGYIMDGDFAYSLTQAQSGLATSAEIAALNDISPAEVNAEMVDVLTVDEQPELTGDPGATPTIAESSVLRYMWLRNANTATASQRTIKNNAGSTVLQATISDDGTTYTQGKLAAP